MAHSVPQLDVFYIDFSKGTAKKRQSKILDALGETAIVGSAVIPAAGMAGPVALASFLTPVIFKGVKDLINNNRFYIITSEEELKGYENPNGNAWQTNEKSLKKKQYYIRHPKVSKKHILIEAGDFFEYIEDEQIEELVHFVKAHCDAKRICIERTEISQISGEAKAKIKQVDASADAEHKKDKHICVCISNPNGFPREQPREKYDWIEGSVIQGIKCLTEGSQFEKSYDRDFTFGLSGKEASTIGLKVNMHKNYSYKIQVETVEQTQILSQAEELSKLKLQFDKNKQEMEEYKNKSRIRQSVIAALAGVGVVVAVLLAILL